MLEMAQYDRKWLELPEMAAYSRNRLEMAKTSWNWLEIAVMDENVLKWL